MNDKIRDRRPPPRTDAERWERLSPRELALGTHLDVHGMRRQVLEAIEASRAEVLNAVEHSQSALMMRLDLMDKKIDKLGTGATPSEIKAVTEDLAESREKLAASVAEKPTP